MSAFPVGLGDVLTLELKDCNDFRDRCPEIYEALIDSAAFVNWRRIEMGERVGPDAGMRSEHHDRQRRRRGRGPLPRRGAADRERHETTA